MKKKLLFAGLCLLIFVCGFLFSVNLEPYYHPTHYERHWSRMLIAAVIAVFLSYEAWVRRDQ